jgi:hypothetical protein
MDRFDDDTLFAELREVRPTPRPEFTAQLDERAAAGFPRRIAPSATAWPFVWLADRWRETTATRRLMPVLAVALAALVIATAVVAISQSGGGTNPAEDASLGVVSSGSSAGGGAAGESAEALPSHTRHSGGHNRHPVPKGETSGETIYEPEVPSVESTSKSSSGLAAGSEAEESGEAEAVSPEEPAAVHGPANSATAVGGGHRDIEQSTYIVLGTQPGNVSGSAAKVYEAVHAADGIVLHSSVQSGKKGATGAIFELLIPSRKVNDALASISQISEVRARHDQTNDITEPTVSAAEELTDSNAAIEGLLKELGSVETEAERESVEARLHEERRRHAAIRASLDNLHERAAMSEVTVRIVTGKGAGATPAAPSSGDGSWGVGDALHDAGHILTIAAGVVLIALAILAPIGLILLLLWIANRFRVRRLRERTLG